MNKRSFVLGMMCCIVCSVSSVWASSVADTVVVTANRLQQHQYKVAGNLTVITAEDIKVSNARTVPDILDDAFGVNVYDNSTVKSAVVDIRGFGETAGRNVLVLINGRKVNSIDISGPDLVQVPVESVERIEILRGAGTVLYGDNAVGGVVNIITKTGEGDFNGRVGVKAGSYDTSGTDVTVSGSTDDVSYYGYAKYFEQGGYRDNSDLLATDYNARLAYTVSDVLALDLDTGWHEDTQRLPGGLSDADLESMGRRASTNPDDFSETKDRYIKLGLDYTPFPEDDYVGDIVLDFYYRNRDGYDSFNSFGAFNTKRNIDTYGVTGKYIFDKFLFNREVNFVAGVDYFYNENDILGSGTNVDDITITKDEFGVYGFLQYELIKDVFVNGGTRYHKADYEFNQRNVLVQESASPDEWVSMTGVKWEYAEHSNMHANVQQTFRFLATDEWYSTANFPSFGITPGLQLGLDQQTGVQYEVGVRHQLSDAMVVTATPYVIDLNNEIYFDPTTFGNSNYDETRRVGIEVGQELDVLKWWDLDGIDRLDVYSHYTYQDAEFHGGNNDGNRIPMVPEYQVGAGVHVGFLDHYQWSFSGRYVGERYAINDVGNATPPIKPYTVFDTKISFLFKDLEIYGAVYNLFDEQYETFVTKSTSSSAKSHFPSPERNYMVGMSLKF